MTAPTLRLARPESRQPRHPPVDNDPIASPQVAVSHFLSHTACLESPVSVGDETVDGMTGDPRLRARQHYRQDLDAQLVELTAAEGGAERMFTDELSGSTQNDRPALA